MKPLTLLLLLSVACLAQSSLTGPASLTGTAQSATKAETPAFSADAGTAQDVTILSPTSACSSNVYYTSGASIPADPTSVSTNYTAPVHITSTTFFKAKIIGCTKHADSAVGNKTYTIPAGEAFEREERNWTGTSFDIEGLFTPAALALSGPPMYNGSTSSTAVAVTPPLPALPNVNSTGYAYTNPWDFYYPVGGKGNCITALTDSTTRPGKSFHASWSGGGANVMWDVNRRYGAATDDNNLIYFHVYYDANGCMQRDSDMNTTSLSGGTGNGGFTFSRVTPARAYKVDGAPHLSGATKLYQEDLTGTTRVAVTRTELFNFNRCPGVPGGSYSTQRGNGNLNVSADENIFSTSLNIQISTGVPTTGQDYAHWVLAWNRSTNQCTTYYTGQVSNVENPKNGNIWKWCGADVSHPAGQDCSQSGTNVGPDYLNTTCAQPGYGIHNTQGVHNGQYVEISGRCSPSARANNQSWQLGTDNVQTCNDDLYNCGGHPADGYTSIRQTTDKNDVGMNIRSVSDLSSWTTFHTAPPVDFHGGTNWIGPASDVNPWLASTQSSAVGGSCAGGYLCFELVAFRLDGTIVRFAPNYYVWPAGASGGGLGPIPAMTQDGYCISFESTWNGTRGTKTNGNYRTDLFAICNLQ